MRSVGIAYILWFLLGLGGAHRFYCGRIGTGFLWLLTGGLLGVGWLVDAFLIPTMVSEANEGTDFNGCPIDGDAAFAAYEGRHGASHARPAEGFRVVYCTQCGSPMQVPLHAGGAAYACPKCRNVLQVPA